MIKKFYKFILFICGVAFYVGLQQLIELNTHGFCLQRIQAQDLPFQEKWETQPLAAVESAHVDALLSQSYHFLGAGSECFAFVSADGSSVIKFFKLDMARPVYLHRGIFSEDHSAYAGTLSTHPLTQMGGLFKKVLGMREYRLTRTFSSIKLAYDHLKEETGILYLHLNPTAHLNRHMTLYDSCGIAHTIDLDSAKFFLQKKAVTVEKHFAQLKKEGAHDKAKASIDSFLNLILHRCQKGFADRDILNRNLGFIGTEAIEIDSGSFMESALMKESWIYKQEIFYATLELKEWLEKHYPELCPYLEKQVLEKMTT